MKAPLRITILLAGAAASTALFATCSGGGTDGSGTETTIDVAAVQTGLEETGAFAAVCHAAPNPGSAVRANLKTETLSKVVKHIREASLRTGPIYRHLGSTPPPDEFGDCGGRITFSNYSHSNGVTTATLVFDSFCSISDDVGGNHITLDGDVSFVDTGTPSAFGPITTKIEADSPNGVTTDTETPGGTPLASSKLSFNDFLLQVGVPGGEPTSSNPDRVSIDELRFSNLVSGKSYRQTDYSLTEYLTPSGSQVVNFTGRGYRSNGDFYDIRTTSPLTLDANGDFASGQVTFSGSGSSEAVFTIFPGSVLQLTLTVNGTPVTTVPACNP
jgi:hypothetical protein